jgi:hypothetical protein
MDPSGGIASKTAAKVASTSLNGAIDRFLEEPSLQAAYDKLHALLRDSTSASWSSSTIWTDFKKRKSVRSCKWSKR